MQVKCAWAQKNCYEETRYIHMQRLTNNAMCHLRKALRRSAGIVRALPAVVYGAWIAGCFCGCSQAGDDPESRPGTAQTRVIREDAVLKEIGAFRNETPLLVQLEPL